MKKKLLFFMIINSLSAMQHPGQHYPPRKDSNSSLNVKNSVKKGEEILQKGQQPKLLPSPQDSTAKVKNKNSYTFNIYLFISYCYINKMRHHDVQKINDLMRELKNVKQEVAALKKDVAAMHLSTMQNTAKRPVEVTLNICSLF